MKKHTSIIFLVIFIWGCTNSGDRMKTTRDNLLDDFGYDLTAPSQRYKLPEDLQEISGIAYYKDGILACINDEEGKVFFYNTHQEKIQSTTKFAKKGDFEGITIHKNDIYIIRSDGKLFQFENSGLKKVKSTEIKTPFSSRNNLEGLAYHVENNSLLIACKNKADINDNGITGRAIYQFDLLKNQVIKPPFIHLESESFKDLLDGFGLKKSRHMPFMPSGIGIHPVTKNMFIISSVGKLLLEVNKDKDIVAAVPLSRRLLLQPEGICFDESGNMYIASEGRTGRGYILKFVPEQNQR